MQQPLGCFTMKLLALVPRLTVQTKLCRPETFCLSHSDQKAAFNISHCPASICRDWCMRIGESRSEVNSVVKARLESHFQILSDGP